MTPRRVRHEFRFLKNKKMKETFMRLFFWNFPKTETEGYKNFHEVLHDAHALHIIFEVCIRFVSRGGRYAEENYPCG